KSSYGNYSRGATKMVLENSYFQGFTNPVIRDTTFGDPGLSDLDPRTLSVDGTVTAGALPAAGWTDVLLRLGERGCDALVVPAGSADLERAGVHVVRVLLTAEAGRVG
ncbi:hypothetical protein, partial [Streptomyces sp. NPDC003832]